eukprot:1900675-Amphidinium_carterae.2
MGKDLKLWSEVLHETGFEEPWFPREMAESFDLVGVAEFTHLLPFALQVEEPHAIGCHFRGIERRSCDGGMASMPRRGDQRVVRWSLHLDRGIAEARPTLCAVETLAAV